MKQKQINLALVCTQGGHFEQLMNLSEFYKKYDHFWITNKNKQTISQLNNERKYLNIEYKYSIQDGSNNKNIPIKVSCIETNNELIMDIEYKKLIG